MRRARRPVLLLPVVLVAAVAWAAPPVVAGTVAPGSTTASRCFVDAAHTTFLDRDPTADELVEWVDALAGGTPRHVLITELSRSDEWLAVTVAAIYDLALDRPPDAAGLAYWIGQLRAGALVNRIGAQIFGSAEFYARAGGTDAGFVDALYQRILQRAPDAPGRAFWQGEIAERGRGSVAAEFFASVESRRMRVGALYAELLGRTPSPTDRDYWVQRLLTENDVRLAALIASSPEFASRAAIGCEYAVGVTTSSLADAVEGEAYSQPLTATGGVAPYSWAASGLPAGLTVSGASIVGTSSAVGAFEVDLTVTDADGGTDVRQVALVVDAAVNPIVEVDSAPLHSCALQADGQVFCWGYGFFGQIGASGASSAPRRTAVTDGVGVAAGGAHSCAVRAAGSVRCWGLDEYGQLGDGGGDASPGPVTVSGLVDAVEVSAGAATTCARRATGTVMCWGDNGSGKLGNGTTTDSSVPVPVTGLTDAVEIEVGTNHVCARRATGAVVCWGSGASGRLGNGSTGSSSVPVAVTGITAATDLDVGTGHACAVVSGQAWCWGVNGSGQLGDGTTTSRPTATVVPGLTGVSHLGAGEVNTCAVRTDGEVRCWGSTLEGALGTGVDPTPAEVVTTPTAVPGAAGAAAVEVGTGTVWVIGQDGGVEAWGRNSNSQVGDGTSVRRPTPVGVTFA